MQVMPDNYHIDQLNLLTKAKAGEAFAYHTGNLIADRDMNAGVAKIANHARDLYERGLVTLVQKRIVPGVCAYLAIRRAA